MQPREISYDLLANLAGQMLSIPDVTFAELKMASKGRKMAIGACYNGRRIKDLETEARMAKLGQDFCGHLLGKKEKSVIPVGSGPF